MKTYRLTVEGSSPIEVKATNMAGALMEGKKQTDAIIKGIQELK